MSAISNLMKNTFALLPTSTDTVDSGASDTSSAVAMPSLAQALSQVESTDNSGSGSDSAFNLDLSPDAQTYLQSLSNGGNGSSSSSDASGGTPYLLSNAQQKKLTAILMNYASAPITQDTYDSIQTDLESAGLAPQQLAAQQKVRSFNAVTELVNALSGKSGNINPMNFGSDDTDDSANANAYMQKVVDQWQALSTGSSSDSTSGGSAA